MLFVIQLSHHVVTEKRKFRAVFPQNGLLCPMILVWVVLGDFKWFTSRSPVKKMLVYFLLKKVFFEKKNQDIDWQWYIATAHNNRCFILWGKELNPVTRQHFLGLYLVRVGRKTSLLTGRDLREGQAISCNKLSDEWKVKRPKESIKKMDKT